MLGPLNPRLLINETIGASRSILPHMPYSDCSKTMNQSEHFKRLLALIADIANKEYQQNSWFNKGPFVSSPDEMLCGYFDDCCAKDTINEEANNFTLAQINAIQALHSAMETFSNTTPPHLDPLETFLNPHWDHIRSLARAVGNEFDSSTTA